MDKIFDEMIERSNKMVCGCVGMNHLCDQCAVAVDQARLIMAIKAVMGDLEEYDLNYIRGVLEGKND